ncbi:MAG: hypothetical protein IPJ50_04305 [Betaproteobacteria bacterium]|nr:hypothetical protein [Betaproteobacteria bacterium]
MSVFRGRPEKRGKSYLWRKACVIAWAQGERILYPWRPVQRHRHLLKRDAFLFQAHIFIERFFIRRQALQIALQRHGLFSP